MSRLQMDFTSRASRGLLAISPGISSEDVNV
jgi:hypothetical protein